MKKTVLNIPHAIQLDWYSCGYLSAKGILMGYGFRPKRRTLMKQIGCSRLGTLMPEFREGLRTYGVYLRRIRLSFRSIRRQIDQGRPVLLGTEGACGHLSLIIGYETPDRLAVRNHGFFRRWFSIDEIREQAEGALSFPGVGVFAVYCYDNDEVA